MLRNTLQRLSAHKAPGNDGITPGSLRAAGPDISESLLQLIMKMWLVGAEPIQFKGGLLCAIAKKSQSREVANMRGIMIIDVVGKLAHSLLRQRFLPRPSELENAAAVRGLPRLLNLVCHSLSQILSCKSTRLPAAFCRLVFRC